MNSVRWKNNNGVLELKPHTKFYSHSDHRAVYKWQACFHLWPEDSLCSLQIPFIDLFSLPSTWALHLLSTASSFSSLSSVLLSSYHPGELHGLVCIVNGSCYTHLCPGTCDSSLLLLWACTSMTDSSLPEAPLKAISTINSLLPRGMQAG